MNYWIFGHKKIVSVIFLLYNWSMKLYIQFVTFVGSLGVFVVSLFFIFTLAINLVFPSSTNKLFFPNPVINSTVGFLSAVMIVAFVLLSLLLIFIRKYQKRNSDAIKGENFKLVYYLTSLISVLFFLAYLVWTISLTLTSGVINVNSL